MASIDFGVTRSKVKVRGAYVSFNISCFLKVSVISNSLLCNSFQIFWKIFLSDIGFLLQLF